MSAPQILIAEDSELDFFLIESILQDCPNPPQIQRAVNGEEALELMRRAERSGLEPRVAHCGGGCALQLVTSITATSSMLRLASDVR